MGKKRNKYGAVKVKHDGKTFDSTRECYAYKLFTKLKIPFTWQERYNLIPAFTFNESKEGKLDMVIDFIVDTPTHRIAVDIKGHVTDVARIKYKMLKYQQGRMPFRDYEEVVWLFSESEINGFAFKIRDQWRKKKKSSSLA